MTHQCSYTDAFYTSRPLVWSLHSAVSWILRWERTIRLQRSHNLASVKVGTRYLRSDAVACFSAPPCLTAVPQFSNPFAPVPQAHDIFVSWGRDALISWCSSHIRPLSTPPSPSFLSCDSSQGLRSNHRPEEYKCDPWCRPGGIPQVWACGHYSIGNRFIPQ
jgi:hypothetical protein